VIQSFRCADTERLFHRVAVRRFQSIAKSALPRLLLLDTARSLNDLASIRGNRLEAMKGDRKGQYSIRINDQWRICFQWDGQDAQDVEIVDYH
jgi:proteic killer suppression protein